MGVYSVLPNQTGSTRKLAVSKNKVAKMNYVGPPSHEAAMSAGDYSSNRNSKGNHKKCTSDNTLMGKQTGKNSTNSDAYYSRMDHVISAIGAMHPNKLFK
jgi:hypothetical protein